MTKPKADSARQVSNDCSRPELSWKLWIYSNFDCNLRCSYCVARSGPTVPRRAVGLDTVRRLVDEAVALEFREVFITGGEPFILDDIYPMLAYATARIKSTVLTNAMLFSGSRLDRLLDVANDNLTIQVSLDGARPEHHDPYRGAGTWQRTVDGLRTLQRHGLHLRLSTTVTPANEAHLEALDQFRHSLGIAPSDHVARPLAKRGYAQEGIDVDKSTLSPELTVSVDGVFWHPLSTDEDMLVSRSIFPLAAAVDCVRAQMDAQANGQELRTFT